MHRIINDDTAAAFIFQIVALVLLTLKLRWKRAINALENSVLHNMDESDGGYSTPEWITQKA